MSVLAVSAYGDAIGAPYEFNSMGIMLRGSATGIAALNKSPKAFNPLEKLGEWTDDTYMAIGIANSLKDFRVNYREFTNNVANEFLRWRREHPRGLGNQTAEILSKELSTGENLGETMFKKSRAYFEDNVNNAAGNGSLMRIHPIAIANVSRSEAAELAAIATRLTHWDPRCVDASIMWVDMLRCARETGALDPFSGLDLVEDRKYWEAAVLEALNSPSASFSTKGWWVVPSFQQALSAVNANLSKIGTFPELAFGEIIAAPASDSDTICAIAGSLLGALGVAVGGLYDKNVKQVFGLWPHRMTLSDLEVLEGEIANG